VNEQVLGAPVVASAFSAHGLACRRGDRLLFSGLDVTLGAGEIVWLRGANGQGKTSLLRLLAGLSTPEEGRIERGSLNSLYLAHANALKDDLTALESLRFLCRLQGTDATDDALEAALRRFGLFGRRHAPVRTLSQGQRRRVALARLCLASSTTLWLLDEPFDALDTDGVKVLNALLIEHGTRGGCVLLTSHLPLQLASMQPTVLLLGAATLQ
jgi:heme exporter protein A